MRKQDRPEPIKNFFWFEIQEPEYDDVALIIRPRERIVLENTAAKPWANKVIIRRRVEL